jgi:hypothetical protein
MLSNNRRWVYIGFASRAWPDPSVYRSDGEAPEVSGVLCWVAHTASKHF